MSRNGSGTYTLPAGNPVVTGTTISSTWANNTLTDIATALTGSLAADGQTTATGNLKMGNNRVTGLSDGIASTDAATVNQIPSGALFLLKASNLSDVANATTSRTNLVAAKSGANSDITSLTGLTTALSVAQGGTGSASAVPNAAFVGGVTSTSAVDAVRPSTLGNVLTSTAGSTVTAGSFVVGVQYSILAIGSTDFTLIGASANTIGIVFTATGVGTGSGTAQITTWTSAALTVYPLTSGTTQASTSGTSIDFPSIPSWVKRITVMLNGVSTNGSSFLQVQLGTSSGVTTSGYTSYAWTASASYQSSTTGLMFGSNAGASARYSIMTICAMGSNLWIESNTGAESGGGSSGGGSVTLASTLDRIRLTTVNGTDAFDAGSVNILYE